jgi:hypothetical protein
LDFKKIIKFIVDMAKESIAQIFTLLGFFIAWFTLTGTAQDIVGIAIVISSKFKKIKIILARMVAVFVANGLAVIGAGSLIGVDTVSSILLAGSLGVIKVAEALARAYIDDGKITLDEINESFAIMEKKSK